MESTFIQVAILTSQKHYFYCELILIKLFAEIRFFFSLENKKKSFCLFPLPLQSEEQGLIINLQNNTTL